MCVCVYIEHQPYMYVIMYKHVIHQHTYMQSVYLYFPALLSVYSVYRETYEGTMGNVVD